MMKFPRYRNARWTFSSDAELIVLFLFMYLGLVPIVEISFLILAVQLFKI